MIVFKSKLKNTTRFRSITFNVLPVARSNNGNRPIAYGHRSKGVVSMALDRCDGICDFREKNVLCFKYLFFY